MSHGNQIITISLTSFLAYFAFTCPYLVAIFDLMCPLVWVNLCRPPVWDGVTRINWWWRHRMEIEWLYHSKKYSTCTNWFVMPPGRFCKLFFWRENGLRLYSLSHGMVTFTVNLSKYTQISRKNCFLHLKKNMPPPWIEHGAFRSSVWRSPSWAKAAMFKI